MPVIVFASVKGGTGKTHSAMGLAAVALDHGHHAFVIDIDDQGSALDWQELAERRGETVPAVYAPDALTQPIDPDAWVLVDTPPSSTTSRHMRRALQLADLVLVPSAPTTAEVMRIQTAAHMVAEHTNAPVRVLLNRVRAGTRSPADAREALDGRQEVLAAEVPQREAIAQALGANPPRVMRDAYTPVFTELTDLLKGATT